MGRPRDRSFLTGCGLGTRRRVPHVLVEPAKHLVNELLVRLHGCIPVRLMLEQHHAGRTAITSNSLVELARLDGRSTGIRLFLAVPYTEGRLQFVADDRRRN